MSNVKCQKPNVKCQMPKVNKIKLLSERTFGAPPIIFSSLALTGALLDYHVPLVSRKQNVMTSSPDHSTISLHLKATEAIRISSHNSGDFMQLTLTHITHKSFKKTANQTNCSGRCSLQNLLLRLPSVCYGQARRVWLLILQRGHSQISDLYIQTN